MAYQTSGSEGTNGAYDAQSVKIEAELVDGGGTNSVSASRTRGDS